MDETEGSDVTLGTGVIEGMELTESTDNFLIGQVMTRLNGLS